MTRPVTIRGTAYPSQRAAAEALGMTKAAISSAAKRGALDFVGLGPATGERSAGFKSRKPVKIGAETFASMTEAAAALGVSVSDLSIYTRVARIIAARQ